MAGHRAFEVAIDMAQRQRDAARRVLVQQRDLPGLRRVMTGLDTDSVQMREVSPLGGLLPQAERSKVLAVPGR